MVHPADQGSFQGMGKGTVSDVMQQDRNIRRFCFLFGDGMTLAADRGDGIAHQVHGPEGMLEAGVVGAWIDKMSHPELPDPSQPLKGRVLYQVKDDLIPDLDEAIDRIIDDLELVGRFFLHEKPGCEAKVTVKVEN